MKSLEETPLAYLQEAIRFEEIARVSCLSGDFRTGKHFQQAANEFLIMAADMENIGV